jgi:glycosyltransferase involved in cell wall biosynthesis
MILLGCLALILAAAPAALCLVNRRALSIPLQSALPSPPPRVSILIPARDEAANIGSALDAACASEGVELEILVMDDGSVDGTAAIVHARTRDDARVRLLTAPPLPPGWGGKAHVCQRLSEHASGDFLLFVDADVRLEPTAAVRLAEHALLQEQDLVSAVPRQRMESLGELLTVPTINLLIYGYLPVPLMRRRSDPSLAAACGQILMFRSEAYRRIGGHGAVRTSLHDGLQLARALRRHGLRTDLIAGEAIATCRMYNGLHAAWAGFVKNAQEGMATSRALPIWTILLLGGHVLPWGLLLAGLVGTGPIALPLTAALLSMGTRLVITVATREPLANVPLHPCTVLVALAIQWDALIRSRTRRPVGWKGRIYSGEATP